MISLLFLTIFGKIDREWCNSQKIPGESINCDGLSSFLLSVFSSSNTLCALFTRWICDIKPIAHKLAVNPNRLTVTIVGRFH